MILPTDIFERWEINIIAIIRKGNRYIVVAMDYFSRQPEIRIIKAANMETINQFISDRSGF